MRITKAMREDVATKLTANATKAKVKELESKLTCLAEDFWKEYQAQVDQLVKLPKKDWDALIQAGVVNATNYRGVYKPGDTGSQRSIRLPFNRSYSRKVESDPRYDLSRSDVFPGINKFYDTYLQLSFQCDSSKPNIGSEFTCPEEISLRGAALSKEVEDLVTEAYAFKEEVMDILNSCTTKKQLENTLPEAAELLPQPEVKTNYLVPTQVVESVKSKLKNGVPPKDVKKAS